jgi:DNA-binding NarL/FixJ family response regulator
VLELMREKLSTHEIAVRLGVADVTVRRHVGAILHKLRVQTRTEALELLDEEASGDGAYSAGRSPGT